MMVLFVVLTMVLVLVTLVPTGLIITVRLSVTTPGLTMTVLVLLTETFGLTIILSSVISNDFFIGLIVIVFSSNLTMTFPY